MSNEPLPPPEPSAPGEPRGAEFFDRIRGFGAVRPEDERWFAGVAGALARRWALDVRLVRGLFVATTILGGLGVLLYGLGWLFLPQPDGRIHAQQLLHGSVTAGTVGGIIFVLAGLSPDHGWRGHADGFPAFWGLFWTAAAVALIWWLVSGRHRRHGPTGPAAGSGTTPGTATFTAPAGTSTTSTTATAATTATAPTAAPYGYGYGYRPGTPQPVPPAPVDRTRPSRRVTRVTLGLALLASAAVLVWERTVGDLPGATGVLACTAALAVIAVGVIVAGTRGRRSGALALIGILLAIGTFNASAAHRLSNDFRRDSVWRPTTWTQAEDGYDVGAGSVTVDLTALTGPAPTPADPARIPVHLGAGEVTLLVPDSLATRIDAEIGLGELQDTVHHDTQGGPGIDTTVRIGPNSDHEALIIDASLGLGSLRIQQQKAQVTS